MKRQAECCYNQGKYNTIHNRVKKNQLDAQLILITFRQPLHVSGVSMSIIMCTTVGTYHSFYMPVCCLSCPVPIQSGQQAVI